MKQSKCYTCDKLTHNLLTANCSHKICFYCVKNNRNTHKCAHCTLISASKNKIPNSYSPLKKSKTQTQKQKSTKTKSIETKKHPDGSPFFDRSTRKSQLHIQSCSNYMEGSTYQDQQNQIKLLCKQHHQPLTLFSKSTKQAICSICLCSRPKFNQEIMPIKGAESFLKKQNQIQRQQSRVILNDIEKCYKTMKTNHDQFQLYFGSHVKLIGQIFSQLHKELEQKEKQIRTRVDEFFLKKIHQCQQIQQDLSYLIETLQTYRQENKESNTLTQALYVYSSFKVIKKTMKTLNLDYVSYANKNINLLQYNKYPYQSALNILLKFNQQLPLKHEEVISITKRKNRSASSNKKMSPQKEIVQGYSNKKKASSAYQNVLNYKISIGPDLYQQILKVNQQSSKKQPTSSLSYQHLSKPHHTNSLHTYIHQNLQQQSQKPRHSNSTYSYLNQQSTGKKDVQKVLSSSNAFEYELRTPIKNLPYKNQKDMSNSAYKQAGSSQNKQGEKSYEKRKKDQFNVVSVSSINQGLNMNEQEKSLYKRLLKSRFSKNLGQIQQESQPKAQVKQMKDSIQQIKVQQNQNKGYEE